MQNLESKNIVDVGFNKNIGRYFSFQFCYCIGICQNDHFIFSTNYIGKIYNAVRFAYKILVSQTWFLLDTQIALSDLSILLSGTILLLLSTEISFDNVISVLSYLQGRNFVLYRTSKYDVLPLVIYLKVKVKYEYHKNT